MLVSILFGPLSFSGDAEVWWCDGLRPQCGHIRYSCPPTTGVEPLCSTYSCNRRPWDTEVTETHALMLLTYIYIRREQSSKQLDLHMCLLSYFTTTSVLDNSHIGLAACPLSSGKGCCYWVMLNHGKGCCYWVMLSHAFTKEYKLVSAWHDR